MKRSLLAHIFLSRIRAVSSETPLVFSIVFPDGSEGQNREGDAKLRIIVKHWASFVRLGFLGIHGFVVDYIRGHIDIEGDLRYLGYLSSKKPSAKNLEYIIRERSPEKPLVRLLNWWHMLTHRAGSRRQARYNAEFHYGLHPDFYLHYLGPTRAYSTGFWYEDTRDLDEAQYNKWDMILRKLRLTPGLRVCSTGTGFGYGEMLAAEKYGVIVDCYNTCRPQNAWLREEVKRRGLEGKVNVFDADQRDVASKPGTYDRLIAIEHIEHAQDPFRKKTIEAMTACLKEGGVGVMQWLSFDVPSDVHLFIREYLYPGVTMPPFGKMMDELVTSGLEVLDVLCQRRHYYYTLSAWTNNFIQNWDKIHAIDPSFYDERFRRTWLLYLSAGVDYLIVPNAEARLYQVTFSKGDTDTYPMNRDFLYDADANAASWVQTSPWVLRNEEEATRI